MKHIMSGMIFPFFKARFVAKVKTMSSIPFDVAKKIGEELRTVTQILLRGLPREQLFPVVDLWRLILLEDALSAWCASASVITSAPNTSTTNPVLLLLEYAVSSATPFPKPFLLTTLRMLANSFANVVLARTVLSQQSSSSSPSSSARQMLMSLLVSSLLHEDASVRTAAASLTFNVAAHYQKPRIEGQRSGKRGEEVLYGDEEGDWELEIISAAVEALRTETANEDVGEFLHRCVSNTSD